MKGHEFCALFLGLQISRLDFKAVYDVSSPFVLSITLNASLL